MIRSLTIVLVGAAVACACSAMDGGTSDRGDTDPGGSGRTWDPPGPPDPALGVRFRRMDLTADLAGVADFGDPALVDAWGLAVAPDAATGPELWLAANGTDRAVVLHASGAGTGRSVAVPGAPAGLVYTDDPDFLGDELVFATEGGTLAGWQDADGGASVVRVAAGAGGAIYKGLAIVECGHAALAATDFHHGTIDLFGPGYAEEAPRFADPALPAGFAPFGIAQLDGLVYVTYAKQDDARADDVPGAGNGYVDVFAPDGTRMRRLISGGHLDSPWGLALAPPGFGPLSGKLLVGNAGDGAINVYEPGSGAWLGPLRDASGAPLRIDGLWTIAVGPGTDAFGRDAYLLFTAGPDHEARGLFGELELIR